MLITRQEAEEILIDLDTLIDLSIVPPDFPLPQDPELKQEEGYRVCRRTGEEIKRRKEQESPTKPKPIPDQRVHTGFRSRTQAGLNSREAGVNQECSEVPQSE